MRVLLGPSPDVLFEGKAAQGVLGCIDASSALPQGAGTSLKLEVAVLHNAAQACEYWCAADADAVTSGAMQHGHWRQSAGVLMGVLEMDANLSAHDLQSATQAAYRAIFAVCQQQGDLQLWRVWNYFSAVNDCSSGLERYRQFNLGRSLAYAEQTFPTAPVMPAASVLGLAHGPLRIAFLAGKQAIQALENPRQVSAYHYPKQYGPSRPLFSRAALAHCAQHEILWISGTASIVGHATQHVGNVQAQTVEICNNLDALLAVAAQQTQTGGYALDDLIYRVYVRHAHDWPAVHTVLTQRVGAANLVALQADICRADLLVEVEAHAVRAC